MTFAAAVIDASLRFSFGHQYISGRVTDAVRAFRFLSR